MKYCGSSSGKTFMATESTEEHGKILLKLHKRDLAGQVRATDCVATSALPLVVLHNLYFPCSSVDSVAISYLENQINRRQWLSRRVERGVR
jgi:hypothetical protein